MKTLEKLRYQLVSSAQAVPLLRSLTYCHHSSPLHFKAHLRYLLVLDLFLITISVQFTLKTMEHLWQDDSLGLLTMTLLGVQGRQDSPNPGIHVHAHTYIQMAFDGQGCKDRGFHHFQAIKWGSCSTGRVAQGGRRTSLGWDRTGCGSIGVEGDPRWCDNNPLTFPSEEGFPREQGYKNLSGKRWCHTVKRQPRVSA